MAKAKKGGLGTGFNTLLHGSERQRRKQMEAAGIDDTAGVDDSEEQAAAVEVKAPAVKTDPKAVGSSKAGSVDRPSEENPEKAELGDRLQQLDISEIRPGSYQPRRNFETKALQELADSLKQQGLIQPILVRPYAGRYEIIAGERRWRAAELAGLTQIPAIIRELDDRSVAAVALIENIQRKDLNPLEEAVALQRLRDEFDMTQEAVAESVGRSRAAVANILRLLDLHEDVKLMLESGEIDMGHARALLALDIDSQLSVAQIVVKQSLSVRATENLVRQRSGRGDRGGKRSKRTTSGSKDPNITSLERKLGDTLGAQVEIHQKDSGKGKLEISYNSLDELDGILQHIK